MKNYEVVNDSSCPIVIQKSPSADSRSAKTPPTVEELTRSTEMHIEDVSKGLQFISKLISHRGKIHDNTKLSMMEEFHAALNSGKIKESEWYQKHITEERHHLKSNVPEDVTLVDVIEHLVDCTMAGLARSGDVYDVDLDPNVLVLACENTVKLLKDNTTVESDEDDIMEMEV